MSWTRGLAAVLGLAGVLWAGTAAAQTAAAQTGGKQTGGKAPNIVVVLADDVGFTDFGAYGGEIPTPNIDALARRGARFSNYHTTPMCAPSRAMLMTGLDSHRAGMANLQETTPPEHRGHPSHQERLAEGVETVAMRLKRLGYHTFMAGKWHLGREPGELGFDRAFSLDSTGGDNWDERTYFPLYDATVWHEDGKRVSLPDDFYSSEFLVDRMIAYVDGRPEDGQPFFAYLPFQAIHIPVQAPEAFVRKHLGAYDAGWDVLREARRSGAVREGLIPADASMAQTPPIVKPWRSLTADERAAHARNMAVNAAMLEAMDHHLGRFIEHLKARGEYENTLFLVLSDNGPEAGDPLAQPIYRAWLGRQGYDLSPEVPGGRGTFAAIGPGWASAAAAPLSLYKFYTGEGGMRVPLVVAGPGVAAGQTVRAFSIVSDIAPTLLERAGAGRDAWADMDGRSLWPVLSGQAETVYGPEESVALETAGDGAVFRGRFKLTRNLGPQGDPAWRLYDLDADPGETRDLSAQHPELAAQMLADYEAYAARVGVAEFPEGFSADRQVGKNVARHILADFRGTILTGLAGLAAVVLAVVGGLYWLHRRDPALGRKARRIGARLLAGLAGAVFLGLAFRVWADPSQAAGLLGLRGEGALGAASLRADVGGFLGAVGGFSLAAAIFGRAALLVPPAVLLALALGGRLLNRAVGGGVMVEIPPIIVEGTLLLLVLIAMSGLRRGRYG